MTQQQQKPRELGLTEEQALCIPTHECRTFLRAVLGPTPQDARAHTYVNIRTIPPAKAQGHCHVENYLLDDLDQISAVAIARGDTSSDVGVYYGVGRRIATADGKLDKNSVHSVACAWVDIDCDNYGWDSHDVVRHLSYMPGALKPSVLAHSGGGLHLYWLLDKTTADQSRIEALNKSLIDIFAGDPSCFNVDRVMRVPGTFNPKRKATSRVLWLHHWNVQTLEHWEDSVVLQKTVLGPNGFVSRKERLDWQTQNNMTASRLGEFGRALVTKRKHMSDQEIWGGAAPGGSFGKYGLNEAATRFIASFWARNCKLIGKGETIESLTKLTTLTTCEWVRQTLERYGQGHTFDKHYEYNKYEGDTIRWAKKYAKLQATAKAESAAKRAAAKAAKLSKPKATA